MITTDKVKIFARYDGDGDMFGRTGNQTEKAIINDEDWWLIESMLQDHIVIKRALVSEERKTNAILRFENLCENENVINQISLLAEKVMKSQKFV